MTLSRKVLLAWMLVLAWMALIFALSAIPETPQEPGLPHAHTGWIDHLLRDTAHVAEYGILGVLLWLALRHTGAPGAAHLWAGAGSMLYGASDELHQWFVPGRTCSLLDWSLDAAGAVLALLLFVAWRRAWERQVPRTSG